MCENTRCCVRSQILWHIVQFFLLKRFYRFGFWIIVTGTEPEKMTGYNSCFLSSKRNDLSQYCAMWVCRWCHVVGGLCEVAMRSQLGGAGVSPAHWWSFQNIPREVVLPEISNQSPSTDSVSSTLGHMSNVKRMDVERTALIVIISVRALMNGRLHSLYCRVKWTHNVSKHSVWLQFVQLSE